MTEYNTWLYSQDVHEGTNRFYNYFFDTGSGVEIISIEDLPEDKIGDIYHAEGSYEDMEEDILNNYDLEKVNIKHLEHLFMKRAFNG